MKGIEKILLAIALVFIGLLLVASGSSAGLIFALLGLVFWVDFFINHKD